MTNSVSALYLYSELTKSLEGQLEEVVPAFLSLFAFRYGDVVRKTRFEPEVSFQKLVLRGRNYEGLLTFKELASPKRFVVEWEGRLPAEERADNKSTLLFLTPQNGPFDHMAFYRADSFVHTQSRRFGLFDGEQAREVIDLDAFQADKRKNYSSVTREILKSIDFYQFEAAIRIIDANRFSMPETELVWLYRAVAELTHKPIRIPNDGTLKTIVDRLIENIREHQGVTVVLEKNGEMVI
jgi:hypothetical protein